MIYPLLVNMTQSQKFYLQHIKKLDHIIGGSVAINKQVSGFRHSNDIDIMLGKEDVKTFMADKEKYEIKKSEYSDQIFSMVFDDDSKIDLIISDNSTQKIVKIDGVRYLSIDEIIKHKIKLLEISINNLHFNEHNKHLKDLISIVNLLKI